jgi:CheY-like chemotaxis protein
VRKSLALLLTASGYTVRMAEHGFDALSQLRARLPVMVISDLNMPQMSGFELLSVVRRRFPQLPVVAMSSDYEYGDAVPGGVVADAFYPKGRSDPRKLLDTVAGLIKKTTVQSSIPQRESAPVWIPCTGRDSRGTPFVVLTCGECLRSFPFSVERRDLQKIQETPCAFCFNTVCYMIDFSITVASARKDLVPAKNELRQTGTKRSERESCLKDPDTESKHIS